jgi:hypothetical protein
MAVSKNQLVGKRGAAGRNEDCNGGIDGCLRKYNGANVGATWKTKCAKHRQLNWGIKSKR